MEGCVCKYVTGESQCDRLLTQFEHYCCDNEWLEQNGREKITPLLRKASQIKEIRPEDYGKSRSCVLMMFPFSLYFPLVILHCM